MKKNILRGFASALALAVALVAPNVAAVTAYADDDTTETTEEGGTTEEESDEGSTTTYITDGTQTITKTYTNSNVDETVTFTFELKYSYATKINGNTVDESGLVTYDEDGTETYRWYTTTNITASSDGTTAYSSTISTLLAGAIELITTPGTYYFTLSEVKGTNPNVSYDTSTYTVKVEVVWATTYDEEGNVTGYDYTKVDVASYTIYDSDGVKQNSADFTNKAAESADLKVTKDIQGVGANPKDTFTFTITVTGVSGTYTYTTTVDADDISATTGSVDTTKHTVTADSNGTITLTVVMGDDDSFEILGLPEGAEYTVTESTTAVGTADSNGENGRVYTYSLTSDSDSASGSIDSDDVTVNVVNTLDASIDTGLLLTYGPFALVAVVAAAGIALVVVRRRRSYDEF